MRLEKSKLFYLFITIFVFSLFANGTGGQSQYQTYHNARFDFSISYPADVFIPQGEADNGDGQRFLSKDGKAEMLVYGSNNALQQTWQQAFAEASASRAKAHPMRVVSYKVLRQDWCAVSGTENGKIFYQKTFLKKGSSKPYKSSMMNRRKRLMIR